MGFGLIKTLALTRLGTFLPQDPLALGAGDLTSVRGENRTGDRIPQDPEPG